MSKRWRGDLEDITVAGRDAVGKRQRRGSEEVHVHVAGTAEQGVLEMVMLEIGVRMRHVLLSREGPHLPQRLTRAKAASRSTCSLWVVVGHSLGSKLYHTVVQM